MKFIKAQSVSYIVQIRELLAGSRLPRRFWESAPNRSEGARYEKTQGQGKTGKADPF